LGARMTTGTKIYYLAATLTLTTAAITIVRKGFTADEYVYVSVLLFVVVLLYWLGSRQKPTQVD